MHEARYYRKMENGRVQCLLCRHHCQITPGHRGRCGVRENRDGVLYSLVYGRIVAEHVDPVEKKPFFHLLPGSRSYSIATQGCNFSCRHCQNYAISQVAPESVIGGALRTPDQIVEDAVRSGCRSIAYTYTEPTIYFEFALDTARIAHERGLLNLFVTNGYIDPEPLEEIAPFLRGANIDLKGFSPRFYREIAGASLDGVLDTIRHYKRLGIWIELTTLLIPGLNDSEQELDGIARFIATELGIETPWHISRFYPTYRLLNPPPTPESSVLRGIDAGRRAGLSFVYAGNMRHPEFENTRCPSCSRLLIQRDGYRVLSNSTVGGGCPGCGNPLPGVW